MLRRLIGQPEVGAVYVQLSDDGTVRIEAEEFAGAERGLVEINRFRSVSNREHGGYRRFPIALGLVGHWSFLSVSSQHRHTLCVVRSASNQGSAVGGGSHLS